MVGKGLLKTGQSNFEMAKEYAQQFRSPDMAEALREIRNRLYDSLPTGEIDANASWEMLQSIKRHVGELDNFCASLSSPGRGWVKVEDGLPKIPPPYFENGVKLTPLSCRVIVYDSVLKEVYEADYYDGRFDNNNPDITYWQPLPTPPNP